MSRKHTIKELQDWLEADEAASRARRARRLRHLLQVMPETEQGTLFFGGNVAVQLFEEIRLCYIHSLYLATVLLTLSYVEREIAGQLYASGWDPAKSERLESLLLEANQSGLISDIEMEILQDFRRVRNSYVHFRTPLHTTSVDRRALDENERPQEIMETDARKAIEVLASFFRRQNGLG